MDRRVVVRTRSLSKDYHLGDTVVHALRGVTLDIHGAEFVAVMGASGSGKSTFVNILGCLDRPTRGSYELDGQDVSELTPNDRAVVRKTRIGFVFQGFNLLQRTTALENVEMPLHYARVPAKERRARATALLAAVGLADRAHHFPSQLSGGQQQRIAIARALVNKPTLILADEPTGNLDSRTSVEIIEILQRLSDEEGMTIVLITHEEDIARFAQRQVLFRDGRIKADRPVDRRASAAEVLRALPPEDEEEQA
ncbi:MAG: ABC transporter ATP-binding protein [Acidobacteria bacterium]|nr:ABC transporter ATP-binding protein [Acidobacteriota bacterium]